MTILTEKTPVHEMTDSEMVQHIYSHLKEQDGPCLAPDPVTMMSCRYHFKNLACAVGCLVPEEIYIEDMEFKGLDGFWTPKFAEVRRFLGLHLKRPKHSAPYIEETQRVRILNACQRAHDNYNDVSSHTPWQDYLKTKFETINRVYSLKLQI